MAAFRYPITPNQPDSHQSNPWWLMCVVRYGQIRTYDRDVLLRDPTSRTLNVSTQEANDNPVAEREPLILSGQILAWSVNEQKSAHTSSANFTLAANTHVDKLVVAGDWIFFWAFDNAGDFQRVSNNLRTIISGGLGSEAIVNGFHDGLRFIGRANSPKHAGSVDPGSGTPSNEYELTAMGFSEFDSQILYKATYGSFIEQMGSSILAQLQGLAGTYIDETIAGGLPLSTEQHAQLWLKIFLGSGPGATSKGFREEDIIAAYTAANIRERAIAFSQEAASSLIQSPNDAFLVPRTVARLLGVYNHLDHARYIDILSVFMGIAAPRSGSVRREVSPDVFEGLLAPHNLAPESLVVPIPTKGLSGTFRPQMQDLGGASIWDLLMRYTNNPINEAFTRLGPNAAGQIVPTFVIRQTPFSSRRAARTFTAAGLNTVAFAELPRYVMHPGLVVRQRVGPSDSLRINYISVQGTDVVGENIVQQQLFNDIMAPPVADLADIKRNGLRAYVVTINSDVSGVVEKQAARGRWYTAFMADILLPGHLKWNGSLQTHGVQLPVTAGDNMEWDNVIYHVEGRVDQGGIDGNGRRFWRTSFNLSSGISVAESEDGDDLYPHEHGAAERAPHAVDYESLLVEGETDFGADEQRLREEINGAASNERLAAARQNLVRESPPSLPGVQGRVGR
jgi:hypothetical protein